jgi:CBS domain-containing protein
MKVRDVMTQGPASIRSTATVREAIDVLQSLNVRHLPIVDAHGELIGILSDRDLHGSAVRPDSLVSLVMSTLLFTVQPEADVRDVIDLMIAEKIGAVPVLDSDGALVGIVSYVDLLRELGGPAGQASTECTGT